MPNISDLLSTNTANIATNTTAVANAGGAWELVSTTEVTSNVSSVDFTGLATGYLYKVIFQNVKHPVGIGSKYVQLRWMNGTSAYADGIYHYGGFRQAADNSVSGKAQSGQVSAHFFRCYWTSSGGRDGVNGEVTIYNMGVSGRHIALSSLLVNSLSSAYSATGAFNCGVFGNGSSTYDAGNIDGIRMMLQDSTNIAAGTFTLLKGSLT